MREIALGLLAVAGVWHVLATVVPRANPTRCHEASWAVALIAIGFALLARP